MSAENDTACRLFAKLSYDKNVLRKSIVSKYSHNPN